MIDLWFEQAAIYNGLPLDDRTALEQTLAERPSGSPPRDRYVYYPDCASVPEQSGVMISGRSYTIAAGVRVDNADAAGCPLRPRRCRRRPQSLRQGPTPPLHVQLGGDVPAGDRLRPGGHHGRARLHRGVHGRRVGAKIRPCPAPRERSRSTWTTRLSGQPTSSRSRGCSAPSGDGICVGRDDASPVTPDYVAPFTFTGGEIDKVVVDVSGDRYVDHEAQVRGWFLLD